MKNTIKAFIALLMVAGLWSCENEDNFMIAEAQPAAFAILTPDSGAAITITEATSQTNTAATFTWEDADYGTPTAVTYDVEFAANGTDFASPVLMTSSAMKNYSITFAALNAIATNLSATPVDPDAPQPVAIDVRIKSSVGTTGSEPLYSNVITISVTPFVPTVTEIPKIYVVGGFQGASGYGSDWTPSTAVPLAASSPTTTDFEGYVYFADGASQYKFLPQNTGWDGDYGDTGASDGSYSGTLEQDGEVNAGLPNPVGGYYRVKVNLGATPPTYTLGLENWAITGSATPLGWPSDSVADTDMTYDVAAKVWTITMDLTGGNQIKFRANDGWDTNLGDTGADGSLDYGGSDITVPASGNYTVHLDLSNPRQYTYSLTLN